MQWMATDLQESRITLAGHQGILDELMTGMEILHQYAEEAILTARTAERASGRMETACCVFGGLLLIILVMFLVGTAISFLF